MRVLSQIDRIAVAILKAVTTYEDSFDERTGQHKKTINDCCMRTTKNKDIAMIAYIMLSSAWNDAQCWAENRVDSTLIERAHDNREKNSDLCRRK